MAEMVRQSLALGACAAMRSCEELGKLRQVVHYLPIAERAGLLFEPRLRQHAHHRLETLLDRGISLADQARIDAEPETKGGEDFMGTMIHFGSDAFKAWEDVLTYFERLGGQ